MLLNNHIDGFIPVELRFEDNKKCFYYNTKGMKPLSGYMDTEHLGYKIIFDVYNGIIYSLSKGEEYFLNELNYVVKPEYIYYNTKEKKVNICCVPFQENDFQKDVLELTELFLKKVNHKDNDAVKFIYGLYDILSDEGFEYDSVRKYINNFLKKDEDVPKINKENIINNSVGEPPEKAYGLILCNDFKPDKKFASKTVPEKIWFGFEDDFSLNNNDKTGYTLGRNRECDIYIPFIQVSRKHAIISPENNGLAIADMGSTNGTYINGKKISANITTRCKINDVVTFADISYKVIKNDL